MDSERFSNREKEISHITAEIGSGKVPIMLTSLDRLKEFRKNPSFKYIGVDAEASNLITGKVRMQKELQPKSEANDRALFVLYDGEQIPLQDESVNEVVLANMLGASMGDDKFKLNLLEEARRILKESGTLRIIETYTPEFALDFIDANMQRINFNPGKKLIYTHDGLESEAETEDRDVQLLKMLDRPDNFIWDFKKLPGTKK